MPQKHHKKKNSSKGLEVSSHQDIKDSKEKLDDLNHVALLYYIYQMFVSLVNLRLNVEENYNSDGNAMFIIDIALYDIIDFFYYGVAFEIRHNNGTLLKYRHAWYMIDIINEIVVTIKQNANNAAEVMEQKIKKKDNIIFKNLSDESMSEPIKKIIHKAMLLNDDIVVVMKKYEKWTLVVHDLKEDVKRKGVEYYFNKYRERFSVQ